MITDLELKLALAAIDVPRWGESKRAVLLVVHAEEGRELSDREIARRTYGFHLGTVRWALRRLTDDGVLKRGRAGAGHGKSVWHVLDLGGWSDPPVRDDTPWELVVRQITDVAHAAGALDYVAATTTDALALGVLDGRDAELARGLADVAATTSRLSLARDSLGRALLDPGGVTDDLLPPLARGVRNRALLATRVSPRRLRAVLRIARYRQGLVAEVDAESTSARSLGPRASGDRDGALFHALEFPPLEEDEENREPSPTPEHPASRAVVAAIRARTRAPIGPALLDRIDAACGELDADAGAWLAREVHDAAPELGAPMLVAYVAQLAAEGPPPTLPGLAPAAGELPAGTRAPCPNPECRGGVVAAWDPTDRNAPAVPCSTCFGRSWVLVSHPDARLDVEATRDA